MINQKCPRWGVSGQPLIWWYQEDVNWSSQITLSYVQGILDPKKREPNVRSSVATHCIRTKPSPWQSKTRKIPKRCPRGRRGRGQRRWKRPFRALVQGWHFQKWNVFDYAWKSWSMTQDLFFQLFSFSTTSGWLWALVRPTSDQLLTVNIKG